MRTFLIAAVAVATSRASFAKDLKRTVVTDSEMDKVTAGAGFGVVTAGGNGAVGGTGGNGGVLGQSGNALNAAGGLAGFLVGRGNTTAAAR